MEVPASVDVSVAPIGNCVTITSGRPPEATEEWMVNENL